MPQKFDLDTDFVRKLAKLLKETGLSEIEYAEGDKKIRCAITQGAMVHAPAIAAPAALVPASPAPLIPSGLRGLGASSLSSTATVGISLAETIR